MREKRCVVESSRAGTAGWQGCCCCLCHISPRIDRGRGRFSDSRGSLGHLCAFCPAPLLPAAGPRAELATGTQAAAKPWGLRLGDALFGGSLRLLCLIRISSCLYSKSVGGRGGSNSADTRPVGPFWCSLQRPTRMKIAATCSKRERGALKYTDNAKNGTQLPRGLISVADSIHMEVELQIVSRLRFTSCPLISKFGMASPHRFSLQRGGEYLYLDRTTGYTRPQLHIEIVFGLNICFISLHSRLPSLLTITCKQLNEERSAEMCIAQP